MSQSENHSSRPPLPHSMRDRKPWPMWPMGLAIVAFIAIYTYINIAYRKDGRAYEPYRAMRERQEARVEKNFYDWYGLKAERADDQATFPDPITTAGQETELELEQLLPLQLQYYIASRPILVPGPVRVESPPSARPGEPLHLRLWLPATLADDQRLILLAFYKETELYLLPTLFVEKRQDADDALSGPLSPLAFEIPTDPIDPGNVRVTLLSEGSFTQWDLQAEEAQ